MSKDSRARIGYLRALSIGALITQVTSAFLDAETKLLDGQFDCAITDAIPLADALAAVSALVAGKCYGRREVLEIELAGYRALGALLEMFIPVAVRGPRDEQDKRVAAFLKDRRVDLDQPTPYARTLRVTDYLSGMTDRHALGTYRRLSGIALPGRM